VLEITEIADRVVKAGGPALLFTDPKGTGVPVLINQFGSDERMCLALRARSYDELSERVKDLIALEAPHSAWEKVKSLVKLKDLAALQPKLVGSGACQAVVHTGDAVDLGMLPILQCWPLDAGRYITLPWSSPGIR